MILSINAGDTVVWAMRQTWTPTNYVESYGGEFKSPILHTGESFSFTFTNAGFYAYKTAPPGYCGPGTITVNGWTGGPPTVTINAPIEGTVLPTMGAVPPVLVSVADSAIAMTIDFFANSNLIGTASSAPFEIYLPPGPSGPCVLQAKATDWYGRVFWSQPVNITLGLNYVVWGPRVLPTGETLLYYNGSGRPQVGVELVCSDSPLFTNYTVLPGGGFNLGAFVDESVRGAAVPRRFYMLRAAPP